METSLVVDCVLLAWASSIRDAGNIHLANFAKQRSTSDLMLRPPRCVGIFRVERSTLSDLRH